MHVLVEGLISLSKFSSPRHAQANKYSNISDFRIQLAYVAAKSSE